LLTFGDAVRHDHARLGHPATDQRVSLVVGNQVVCATVGRSPAPLEVLLGRSLPDALPVDARLRYLTASGVVHRRGRLVGRSPNPRHPVIFEPGGPPQLLLTRQALRADLQVPVLILRDDAPTISTSSLNLSEGGVLLATRSALAVGDHIRLRMHLDGLAEPLFAHAQIVRFDVTGCAAAHFTDIDSESVEELAWRIFNDRFGQRTRSPDR
jgi:hypothetical protein